MPTGYTAKLNEGEQSFTEFVLTCARNFGALITMREDSLEAPIPDAFVPSAYHAEALDKERAEFARITALSSEECEQATSAEHGRQLAEWRGCKANQEAIADRYRRMIEQVNAWAPPTPDHVGLRDFMIQQLQDSLKWDCGYEMEEPQQKTGAQWQADRIATISHSIAYHQKGHADEVARVAARNAWVAALRSSLKPA